MAKKEKGFYSAEAIQGRQQEERDKFFARQEQQKQQEQPAATPPPDVKVYPSQVQPIESGFTTTPPTGGLDWDYKTSPTDMQGKPLQTHNFAGVKIKPQGFDPQGNPYFGAGLTGWMKKWAYKITEDYATSEDANKAWGEYAATSGTFSQNVTQGLPSQSTQEEKTARAQEQGSLFVKGVGEWFDAVGKSGESSGSLAAPLLRLTTSMVGMTLEAFQTISELPEKGMGANRAMREFATERGALLPDMSFDSSDGDWLNDAAMGGMNIKDPGNPIADFLADNKIAIREDAANFATRIFNPLMQGYDALRFWTAPGTVKEKTEAIQAGWSEGRMLYTELVKPAVRAEYLQRVQAGEDPDLLAMELEDPWVEMAGEVLLDPLNFVGMFGKAKKAATALDEAAQLVEKSGMLADAGITQKFKNIAALGNDAQASKALAEIEDDVIKYASRSARELASAQAWKATDLTPIGNQLKHRRTVANYMSTAIQAIRNNGGSPDDVLDYVVALVKRAGGERTAVRESIAAIAHSPLATLSYNDAAFETGYMLRNVIGDGDNLVKALKGGDWTDLRKVLDKKITDGMDYAFPSVKELQKASEKAVELSKLGQAADAKTLQYAEQFRELQKTHPGVVKWAGVQDLVQSAVRPINGALANSYFSLSYGYAFRNFMQNMVTLWADDGVDLANLTTSKLDDFLIGQFGEIPVGLRGKTMTESITEGSLFQRTFDALNKWKLSPAALADRAEVYASKMIYVKKYKESLDSVMKLGGALPDAAQWQKAGFTPAQANDFIDLIKANNYDEAAAFAQFNKKYGSGSVDKWRQLDWVNPQVKQGLEQYEDYWKRIVDITNKEDATQSEVFSLLDEMKLKVKRAANKVTGEPTRMDMSNPHWKDFADEAELAGSFHKAEDTNKMVTLELAYDKAAGEFNQALRTAANKISDPKQAELRAKIFEFTDDTVILKKKQALYNANSELRTWAVGIRDSKIDPMKLWDEAILGPRPASLDKKELMQAVWNNFYERKSALFNGSHDNFLKEAQELAAETGAGELFAKAQKATLELDQYRDYIYNKKGIFTKPPKLTPSKLGDTANANNVRMLAKTYGDVAPSTQKLGQASVQSDKYFLNVINKYAPSPTGKYKRLEDVPLDEAEKAFALHKGRDVKGFVQVDKPKAKVKTVETGANLTDEAVKMPRSELPEEVSQRFEMEARRMTSELFGGEAGKRTAQGVSGTTNVSWYRELYQKGLRKPEIEKALQKIIIDQGADKGVTVEKMKDFMLDTFRYGDETNGVPPDLRVLSELGVSDEKIKTALDAYNDITKQNLTLDEAIAQSSMGDKVASFGDEIATLTPDDALPYYDDAGNLVEPPSYTPKPVTEGLSVPPPRDPNTAPVGHVHSEIQEGMLDALNHIEAGIKERWGKKIPVGVGDVRSIMPDLGERMAFAKSKAQIVAEKFRDFALLPYGETKNMDFALSLVYPYQFWYSRSYSNWMKRAFMYNPEIISRYANLKEAMSKEQSDLPDWWKSQLNVSKLLGIETDNPIYINLEATLWPLYGLTGTDFDDPQKRTNWFTSTLDDMGKFGPSMWAPIQWGVASYYAIKGEKESAAKWGGRAIPQTAALKSISSFFGTPVEFDPAVQLFSGNGLFDFRASDPYEESRISRALAAMESEGIPEEALIEAARTHQGDLWNEAYQRAVKARAGGQLSSFFFGVGFKGRTREDAEIDQFYADYFRMKTLRDGGYMSKDQYSQAFNEMRERYPFMDVILLSRRAGDGREAAYAYNVIGRIPPGMSSDIFKAAGIDPATAQAFYDGGGKFEGMGETERARFMAAMVDIGAILAIPQNATREDWTEVRAQYNRITEMQKQRFGEDIGDKIETFYGIDNSADKKLFMQANPEVQEAMDFKTALIAQDPTMLRYYGGVDVIERYYTGQMFDTLEKTYGEGIFDLEQQYYELNTSKEKSTFKKENPELAKFFEDKERIKNENIRKLVQFGEILPARPELQNTEAQNPTQQNVQDISTPQPQVTFDQWQGLLGEEVTDQIVEFYQSGEEPAYYARKEMQYQAEKLGIDYEELLRLVLLSSNVVNSNP